MQGDSLGFVTVSLHLDGPVFQRGGLGREGGPILDSSTDAGNVKQTRRQRLACRGAPGAGGETWKSGELNEGAAGGGGHGEVMGAVGQVRRRGVRALDGSGTLRRQWGPQTEGLGQDRGMGAPRGPGRRRGG